MEIDSSYSLLEEYRPYLALASPSLERLEDTLASWASTNQDPNAIHEKINRRILPVFIRIFNSLFVFIINLCLLFFFYLFSSLFSFSFSFLGSRLSTLCLFLLFFSRFVIVVCVHMDTIGLWFMLSLYCLLPFLLFCHSFISFFLCN